MYPVNTCACNNTYTCTGYAIQITQVWDVWWDRWLELHHEKQWRRVRHVPVVYHRPNPRPLSIKRVNGRGMFVRRVKPLNRRNK